MRQSYNVRRLLIDRQDRAGYNWPSMLFTRKFEIGAWALYFLVANFVGATSVIMERARQGIPIDTWEPFSWEYTSGFMTLVLIPLILWLDSLKPLRADSWKSAALMHIAATVPFSLLHVGGMVWLRKGIYALNGRSYDFGNVPVELLYEFRKDFLTYFLILGVIYAWRLFRASRSGAHYEVNDSVREAQFVVKSRGLVQRIAASSIDWVEAAGNYVILHVGDSSHPLRDTMKGIGERLGSSFCRVHRSAIVNLARVASTQPTQSGDLFVRLDDGTELRCSRTMRIEFEGQLKANG